MSENMETKSNEKPRPKKKGRVSVRLTAILLVIALLFGVIVGFALGRSYAHNELIEARIEINSLSDRIAELEGSWNDTDGLTDENIDALNLLYGDGADGDVFGDDEALAGYEDGVTESVVVAEFNGGTLLSDEVADGYNDRIAGYIFSGYTESEIPESLLDELIQEKAEEKVLMLKAQELGVYELTDADRAEIATEAENSFNELISVFRYYTDYVGKEEDQIIAETKEYLAEYEGISYDSIYEMLSESWWTQKLYDEAVKDVRIESTDIIELYNEKLSAQQADFSEYPEDYESLQMSGEIMLYNLDGYRAVRLLSVSPEEPGGTDNACLLEEEIAKLDPEADAEKIAQYQAELDATYASAEATMQEIVSQLDAGADFDELLAQYGEDLGMQIDSLRETGYYVSENSILWSESIIQAAFSLENVGDISEPFRMNGCVCILKYLGDVTPGAVSVDEMYDTIAAEALELARSEAYDAKVAEWIAEADVRIYPDRMR